MTLFWTMTDWNKRSIFLPGESWDDVQSALAKADTDEERHKLMSDRMKTNGWTKEKELRFRKHCEVVGFNLAFQREKENPLEKNTYGRTSSRMLAESIAKEFRKSKSSDKMDGGELDATERTINQ